MLLLGVPGTGKSLLARAIAGSWGLPLLRLEMARVLGSLVGQSEARTQGALRLAEAMAPCAPISSARLSASGVTLARAASRSAGCTGRTP